MKLNLDTNETPLDTGHVIFCLVTEDLQDTAKDHIGRELTETEINKVDKLINNSIDWSSYVQIAIDCLNNPDD